MAGKPASDCLGHPVRGIQRQVMASAWMHDQLGPPDFRDTGGTAVIDQTIAGASQ
jgi:hypothetical protein